MKKIVIAAVAVAVCGFLAAGCSTGLTVSTSAAPTQPAVSSAAASSGPVATETAGPGTSASASGPASEQPYKVAVSYDLATEQASQKSVDEGHSPWRLDPAFVAQVFVGLQMEPGGIEGDYPIPYEDFKAVQDSQSDAVVTVDSEKSPTAKVYLKQLVRQGDGGIWTVVGYDPK